MSDDLILRGGTGLQHATARQVAPVTSPPDPLSATITGVFPKAFRDFQGELTRRALNQEPEIKVMLGTLGKLADAADASNAHFAASGEGQPIDQISWWLFGLNHESMTRSTLLGDYMYLLELRSPKQAKSLAEVLNLVSHSSAEHGTSSFGSLGTNLGLNSLELESSCRKFRECNLRVSDEHAVLPTLEDILRVKNQRQVEIDKFVSGEMFGLERQTFLDQQFTLYSDGHIYYNQLLRDNLKNSVPAEYAHLKQEYTETRALRLAVMMTQLERQEGKPLYSSNTSFVRYVPRAIAGLLRFTGNS